MTLVSLQDLIKLRETPSVTVVPLQDVVNVGEKFEKIQTEIGDLTDTVNLMMDKIADLQPVLSPLELEERKELLHDLQMQLEILLVEAGDEEKRIKKQNLPKMAVQIRTIQQQAAYALENLAELSKEVDNPRFKTKYLKAKLETVRNTQEQLTSSLTDMRQVQAEGSFLLKRFEKTVAQVQTFSEKTRQEWMQPLEELMQKAKTAPSLRDLSYYGRELDSLSKKAAEEFKAEVIKELKEGKNALLKEIRKLPPSLINKSRHSAISALKQQMMNKRISHWEALEQEEEQVEDLNALVEWKENIKRAAACDARHASIFHRPANESILERPKGWFQALYTLLFGSSNNPFHLADCADEANADYVHLFAEAAAESGLEALDLFDSIEKYDLVQRFRAVLSEKKASLEKLTELVEELRHFQLGYTAEPEEIEQVKGGVDKVFDFLLGVQLLLECQQENHGKLLEAVEEKTKKVCPQPSHPSLVRLIKRYKGDWHAKQPSQPNLFELRSERNNWWKAGITFLKHLEKVAPIAIVQRQYQKLQKYLEERLYSAIDSNESEEGKKQEEVIFMGAERKTAEKLYIDLSYELDLDSPVEYEGSFSFIDVLDPLDGSFLSIYKQKLVDIEAKVKNLKALEEEKQKVRKKISGSINMQIQFCTKIKQELSSLSEKISTFTKAPFKLDKCQADLDLHIKKLEELQENGALPKEYFPYISLSDLIRPRPTCVEDLSLRDLQRYEVWTVYKNEKLRTALQELNLKGVDKAFEALSIVEKRVEGVTEAFEKADSVQMLIVTKLNKGMAEAKKKLAKSLNFISSGFSSPLEAPTERFLFSDTFTCKEIEEKLREAKKSLESCLKKYEKAKGSPVLDQLEEFADKPKAQFKLIRSFLEQMDKKSADMSKKIQDAVEEFNQYGALKDEAEKVGATVLEEINNAKIALYNEIPVLADFLSSDSDEETERKLFNQLFEHEKYRFDHAWCGARPYFGTITGYLGEHTGYTVEYLDNVRFHLKECEKKILTGVKKGQETLKDLTRAQGRFERANEELTSKLRNAILIAEMKERNEQLIGAYKLKNKVEKITEAHAKLANEDIAQENAVGCVPFKLFSYTLFSYPTLDTKVLYNLLFGPKPLKNVKFAELERYSKQIGKWTRELQSTSDSLQRTRDETLPQQLKKLPALLKDKSINEDQKAELDAALRKLYGEQVERVTNDLLDPSTGQFAAMQQLVERDLSQYIPEGVFSAEILTALAVKENELDALKTEFNPIPYNFFNFESYWSKKKSLDDLSPDELEKHEHILAREIQKAMPAIQEKYPINLLEEQRRAFLSAIQRSLNLAEFSRAGGQRFAAYEIETKMEEFKKSHEKKWNGKVTSVEKMKDLTKELKKLTEQVTKFVDEKNSRKPQSAFEQLYYFKQRQVKEVDNQDLAELRTSVVEEVKKRLSSYDTLLKEMKEAAQELLDSFNFPNDPFERQVKQMDAKRKELESLKERRPSIRPSGWNMADEETTLKTLEEKDWESMNVEDLVSFDPLNFVDKKAEAGIKAVRENGNVGPYVESLIQYNKELKNAKEVVDQLRADKQIAYAVELKREIDAAVKEVFTRRFREHREEVGAYPVVVDVALHRTTFSTNDMRTTKHTLDRLAQTLRTSADNKTNAIKMSSEDQVIILERLCGPNSAEVKELLGDVAKNTQEARTKLQETVDKYKTLFSELTKVLRIPLKWEKELLNRLNQTASVTVNGVQQTLESLSKVYLEGLSLSKVNEHKNHLNTISNQLHQLSFQFNFEELKEAKEGYVNALKEAKDNISVCESKYQVDIAREIKSYMNNTEVKLNTYLSHRLTVNVAGAAFPWEMPQLAQFVKGLTINLQDELRRIDRTKKPSLVDILRNVQDNTTDFVKARNIVINDCKEKLEDSVKKAAEYETMRNKVQDTLIKFDKKFRFSPQLTALLQKEINKVKKDLTDLQSGFQTNPGVTTPLGELNKHNLTLYIQEVEALTAEKIHDVHNEKQLLEKLDKATRFKHLSDNTRRFNETVDQLEKATQYNVSPTIDSLRGQIRSIINQEKLLYSREVMHINNRHDLLWAAGEAGSATNTLQWLLSNWQTLVEGIKQGQTPNKNFVPEGKRVLSNARYNVLDRKIPEQTVMNENWGHYNSLGLNILLTPTLTNNVANALVAINHHQTAIANFLAAPKVPAWPNETVAQTAQRKTEIIGGLTQLQQLLKSSRDSLSKAGLPAAFNKIDDLENYARDCRNIANALREEFNAISTTEPLNQLTNLLMTWTCDWNLDTLFDRSQSNNANVAVTYPPPAAPSAIVAVAAPPGPAVEKKETEEEVMKRKDEVKKREAENNGLRQEQHPIPADWVRKDANQFGDYKIPGTVPPIPGNEVFTPPAPPLPPGK